MIRWSVLTICLAVWYPAIATAHGMDADYVVGPDGFRIEFFFLPDGSPAPDLAVTAQPEQGEAIAVGTTDAKGIVWFRPPSPGAWTIVGKGAGHSNVRSPLVISAEAVGEFLGDQASGESAAVGPAPPVTSAPAAVAPKSGGAGSAPASRRGVWPWKETLISVGFIAVLTVVTYWLMRRSAGHMDRTHDAAHLAREVAELREAVESLRREVEAAKTHDHAGT